MMIHQRELSDILGSLPEYAPFDERCWAERRFDAIICTLGFEDRTSALLLKLAGAGLLRDALLILVRYPTNELENAAHFADFERAAKVMRGMAVLDYALPDFASSLGRVLEVLPVSPRVGFDVSTCASYVFYPTMKTIFERDGDLVILYAEAEVYYPTLLEWDEVAAKASKEEGSLFVQSFEEADFQSLGVEKVYPYSMFAELNPGNRASGLIAIPNFNAVRMNALIARDRELNKTSARDIVWVLGKPPAGENDWRVNALKRTNDVHDLSAENIHLSSTLDYRETIEVLESVWLQRRYQLYLSIAPLGSKMQHLGVFMFLFIHQDVSLWLAEPSSFRTSRYSEGVRQLWQVDFGRLSDVKRQLGLYMTFEWEF